MRTTEEENTQLGKILAEKVNTYTAPTSVLLPTKAISVISAAGQPFHASEADQALFEAIKGTLRDDIPLIEMDCAINEKEFAEACAHQLLGLLEQPSAF